jgi:hypothetical protein
MTGRLQLQFWDIWYPQAGSTGISFARGLLAVTDGLLVHSPPPLLTVEIRSSSGRRLAYAQDLAQTADRPMAILTRHGKQVSRQDCWPTAEEIGQLVLLPGGEVGVLLKWWNAEDGSEWRWQVEFYNRR